MRIKRNRDLAWRKVAGETVVIHLSQKMMYSLNAAGGRIWEAIGEGAELEELESLLLAEASESEAARQALHAFLAELAAEDLIAAEPALPEPEDVAESPQPFFPAILWREEVRRFAGACAKYPGVSIICSQNPQNS